MRIESTCKDCKERHLGCHQDCLAYNDAKDEYERKKEVLKEKKANDKALNSYERERVVKALRKNGIKV